MQVTRLTDLIYAFRLLNLIQKPWAEQDAAKYGIIDAEGNRLRKWSELRSSEEKNSYTYFHRLAFNMKRMLEKVPGFDNRFMQIGAAMRLLKEDTEIERPFTDKEIQFIGQFLSEDAPANVSGAAVSTDIDKRLPGKSMVRRKDAEPIDEIIDPVSVIILALGALAAFPIAKKIALVIEPIIDYIKAAKGDPVAKKEVLAKMELIRKMADKTSGEEKTKLLALLKKLEAQVK